MSKFRFSIGIRGSQSMNATTENAQRRVSNYDYDVCLSFAGENRKYVAEVAETLTERGIKVFYDGYEESKLWGKDLYQHLDYIYNQSARFCVVFISEYYKAKVWTNHEIKSAQARTFEEQSEYILPARFDDTPIPGVRSTIGFIDLRSKKPKDCANLIMDKLAPYKLLEFHERENYFPPTPDIIYPVVQARSKKAKYLATITSRSFFRSLQRLNEKERLLVFLIFIHSCGHDFPENAHIEIGLLRRLSGWPRAKIISTLSAISSVGFEVTFCDGDGQESSSPNYIYLRWIYRNSEILESFDDDLLYCTTISLVTIHAIVRHYCEEHSLEALMRMNFSALSSATAVPHIHVGDPHKSRR